MYSIPEGLVTPLLVAMMAGGIGLFRMVMRHDILLKFISERFFAMYDSQADKARNIPIRDNPVTPEQKLLDQRGATTWNMEQTDEMIRVYQREFAEAIDPVDRLIAANKLSLAESWKSHLERSRKTPYWIRWLVGLG